MKQEAPPAAGSPPDQEMFDPLFSDPVVEAYGRNLDVTLIERCLRLSVAERARQLVQATEFLRRMRPLVEQAARQE